MSFWNKSEKQLLEKLKGNFLTPREKSAKELQDRLQAELNRGLQMFIGKANSEQLRKQMHAYVFTTVQNYQHEADACGLDVQVQATIDGEKFYGSSHRGPGRTQEGSSKST